VVCQEAHLSLSVLNYRVHNSNTTVPKASESHYLVPCSRPMVCQFPAWKLPGCMCSTYDAVLPAPCASLAEPFMPAWKTPQASLAHPLMPAWQTPHASLARPLTPAWPRPSCKAGETGTALYSTVLYCTVLYCSALCYGPIGRIMALITWPMAFT